MKAKKGPRKILVSFIYNDAGNDEGCHSFQARVIATPEQERQIRERLQSLTDLSVPPSHRSDAPIYDLYVGPEGTGASPFKKFMADLDANPYIATHEEALAEHNGTRR